MPRFCYCILLAIITQLIRIDVNGMPILPRSISTTTTITSTEDSEQVEVQNRAPESLDGISDTREHEEKRRTKPSWWPVVGGVLGVLLVGGLAVAAVVAVSRRRSGRPSGSHTKSDNVNDQQSPIHKSFRSTGSMRTVIDEVDPFENQLPLVRKLNRMREMCQFVAPESDAWRGPPSYSESLALPSSVSETEVVQEEPDDDTIIEVLPDHSPPLNKKSDTQSNDQKQKKDKSLRWPFISDASSRKSSKR